MALKAKCLPLDDPDNMWTFCPSVPAAILFSILFGLTTITHIYQARKYRITFAWTVIMGAIWETASFVIRCISTQLPKSQGAYDPHFILFLLAPLWINAFDYMLLGRMVHFYLPNKRLFGIRATRMTLCFVVLDLLSFIIQIGGGMMTLSTNFNTLQNGLHIYTAGVALQEFFILCFLFLVFSFRRRLLREESDPVRLRGAKKLLIILYATLSLITFRILFRIIEFSAGAGTALTAQFRHHEVWQYVFDAMPMFFALALMNIMHPGTVLAGDDSKFDKKTKEEKKAEKAQKKAEKESKKQEKRDRKGEKSSGYSSVVVEQV